jgi:hypothetical protein
VGELGSGFAGLLRVALATGGAPDLSCDLSSNPSSAPSSSLSSGLSSASETPQRMSCSCRETPSTCWKRSLFAWLG